MMKNNTKRSLFWASMLALASVVAVALPAATAAWSTTVTCAPANNWNPDAGQGLVRCGTGYSVVNVETESSTPVFFVWRGSADAGNLATKGNYSTVGKKRCVGCNNGTAYQAEVTGAQGSLFCIAGSGSTDAGVVVSAECAR